MNIKFSYLAVTLVLLTTPAFAGEPVSEGQVLFEDNCVECHGEDASEGASGDIRDVDMQQIRMATGGIEEMPEFEFEDEELEALLTYLHSLQ